MALFGASVGILPLDSFCVDTLEATSHSGTDLRSSSGLHRARERIALCVASLLIEAPTGFCPVMIWELSGITG